MYHRHRFCFRAIANSTRLFSRSPVPRLRVVSAEANVDKRLLTVRGDSSGSPYRLPFSYLWDRCDGGRQSNREAFSTPTRIEIAEDGSSVSVYWSTGKLTELSADWLDEHFVPDTDFGNPLRDVKKIMWGKEYLSEIVTIDFEKILEDDDHLMTFFRKLESYGLVVIKGAKAKSGELLKLGQQFGYSAITPYGSLLKILSLDNAATVGYSPRRFELHSDYTYLYNSPEWFFLHCVEQLSAPSEGSGWYCDGFAVADQLRKEDPKSFNILASTLVPHQDIGSDPFNGNFDLKTWFSSINLNKNGDVQRIIWGNHSRMARYAAKRKNQLHDWYKAYYRFMDIATDAQFLIELKLEPGEILAIHNVRVLHGRKEFKQPKGELRYLEALHFNRDPVYAKLRAKQAKKQK